MAFTPHGKHLVAGEWLDGNGTFTSSPAHGPAHDFAVGTVELVNKAAEAAEDAFLSYGYSSRADRAAFLFGRYLQLTSLLPVAAMPMAYQVSMMS